MNAVNTNTLLGKKVGYWTGQDFPKEWNIQPVYHTGVVIATFNVLNGFENMVGSDILFLEDGYDEPDFISANHDFKILS